MKLTKTKNLFHKQQLRKTVQPELETVVEDAEIMFDEFNLPAATPAAARHDYLVVNQYLKQILPADAPHIQNLVDNSVYVDHLQGNQRPVNIYTEEYLPFHLMETDWVAQYVVNTVKSVAPHEALNLDNVKEYVEHSINFDFSRKLYEDAIVEAQIKYMMNNDKPNGLMPYYNPELAKRVPNWDMQFREIARRSLEFTARLDPHSVETGLEKHADLWRPQTMDFTFESVYNDYQKWIDLDQPNQDPAAKALFKQAYKQAWLKNREYEYYQSNKNIIDQTGTATANMKLTAQEAYQVGRECATYELAHMKAFTAAYKHFRHQHAATAAPTQSAPTNELGR